MSASVVRTIRSWGLIRGGLSFFRQETGQSLLLWLVMALLNFAMQIALRRELLPGEFGTVNTLLGMIALLAVPVAALLQAFALFRPRDGSPERLALIQSARLPVVQNFTLFWTLPAVLLLFFLLSYLPMLRFSLKLFTAVNVVLVLGAYVSALLYENRNQLRFWSWLIFISAGLRLILVIVASQAEPFAETALAVVALAGLFKLIPLLRQSEFALEWRQTWPALGDRDFRLQFAATLSLTLGLFLFSSADRIVAQGWLGRPADNNLGLVPWSVFDGYQTAGLLGRALLWGTQPLLFLLLAVRSHQERTARPLRRLFWAYLGLLVAGAIGLFVMAEPLSRIFGGEGQEATAHYIPLFAQAMLPMGLLQGVGFFALASRRFPECFLLGGASLGYTLLLCLAGRPQVMLSYIFGGGVIALMLVLFVGVVRWGRTQP